MKWSLYLGKPWGIKVYVHWTFLILIGWILFSQLSQGNDFLDALWLILFVLIVFACVTLHEYGHALAARRYGIQTHKITLLPIGGVANLEKIPEKPSEELVVALAGPAVNVAIALLLAMILWMTGGLVVPVEEISGIQPQTFLFSLLSINVVLVAFNLLPAFPMDGGRVLRALLAMRMDRTQSTRIAASIGQFFAILFAFWGLLGNPFLIFIGIFIYLGAQAEYQNVATHSALEGFTVGDIVMKSFTALHPYERISRAVEIMLDGQEQRFVVIDGKQVVGTLAKSDIIKGLNHSGPETPIQQVMNKDVQPLTTDMVLEEAIAALQQKANALAPVMEEGEFVGILDMENISEFILVQSALSKQPEV